MSKYIVLKSEFSSNLVVFNIYDLIPSYLSKNSPFDLSEISARFILSKDSFLFFPFISLLILLVFIGLIIIEENFWDSYCTAHNLLCC